MSNNENIEATEQRNDKKSSNWSIKIIIIIIIAFLLGGIVYALGVRLNNKKIDGENDKIVENYVFKGDAIYIGDKPSQSKQIGLSMKSIITVNKNEVAKFVMKNTGDVNIRPSIRFKGDLIYKAPLLKPGQAVEANVNFGQLDPGEYKFEALANINHNNVNSTGVVLNCKLVVI